ncbi:MAG: hypothetical protein E7550_06630 [Ruminococcaceae bacterium]|nr:hypothetical protein [Oscillospiraceae bacterium]
MKIKKILVFLRRTVFLLLAVSIMLSVSAIFERKTTSGAWNYSLKVGGYKNEPSNSFDILGFGSSHMYCTLNPLSLYDETGLRSYVLATQQQPVEATYYYIKEALKTQNPKIVIVEALMFTVNDKPATEGVAHDAVDPFPSGINRLLMINDMDIEDDKENYYISFLKYHTRWKELTEGDYNFRFKTETDPFRGFVFLTKAVENSVLQVDYSSIEAKPITQSKEDMFLRIAKLVKENDAQLMLLVSPYNAGEEALGRYKYLKALAKEQGAMVLDFNECFEETGINNKTDFYDGGHLNVYGAEKASSFIGKHIMENSALKQTPFGDDADWRADIEYYNAQKSK